MPVVYIYKSTINKSPNFINSRMEIITVNKIINIYSKSLDILIHRHLLPDIKVNQ